MRAQVSSPDPCRSRSRHGDQRRRPHIIPTVAVIFIFGGDLRFSLVTEAVSTLLRRRLRRPLMDLWFAGSSWRSAYENSCQIPAHLLEERNILFVIGFFRGLRCFTARSTIGEAVVVGEYDRGG